MSEPVAWFEQDPDMKSIWYQCDEDSANAVPLYTHPVKELTDEEIDQITDECCLSYYDPSAYREYAKAILRKAQEK